MIKVHFKKEEPIGLWYDTPSIEGGGRGVLDWCSGLNWGRGVLDWCSGKAVVLHTQVPGFNSWSCLGKNNNNNKNP